MSEERSTGRMIVDVLVYTMARLALAVALTAVIYFGVRLFGVTEFPLVIALLFALVIAMPLGMWLFRPLRQRVTASIAAVDARRRRERDDLQARLHGNPPPT